MATAAAARKPEYSPPPINGDFYQIAGTLDAMARVVEINVLELLGEKDLPEPIRPKNFILT